MYLLTLRTSGLAHDEQIKQKTRFAEVVVVAVMARRVISAVKKIRSAYVVTPEDRMTRLRPTMTGLPMHICISIAQPHEAPCVKVASSYSQKMPGLSQLFSVTIPGPADGRSEIIGNAGSITKSDLQKVEDFINLNRDTLVKYWYQLDGCQCYFEEITSLQNISSIGKHANRDKETA